MTTTINPPTGSDTGPVTLRVKSVGTTDVLDTAWVRAGTAQGDATANTPKSVVAPGKTGQILPFTLTNTSPYAGKFDYDVACTFSGSNPNCAPASGQTSSIVAGGNASLNVSYNTGNPGDTILVVVRMKYGGVQLDTAYAKVYIAGTAVTPDAGTKLEPPNTNGRTAVFDIQNIAKVGGITYDLTPTCSNGASGGACTVSPTSVAPNANQVLQATVTYTTTAADSGTVRLISTYAATALDSGKYTVNIAKAIVTPTGQSDGFNVSYPAGTPQTQSFTIQNGGLAQTTFDLSVSCRQAVISCSVAPAQLQLNGRPASGTATLSFNSLGTPGTGTGAVIARYQTVYLDSGWVNVSTFSQGTISVTPPTQSITRAVNTTVVDTFHVINSGPATTVTLTGTCTPAGTFTPCTFSQSGAIGFGANENKVITVTYVATATGTGKTISLTATITGGAATGQYNLTVNQQFVTLASTGLNATNFIAGRCAASCFTARQAMSTVPYFSLDQPRSVTLVYDGDQFALRPVVQLTDMVTAPGSMTVGYQVSAKDSAGAAITFVNGETTLRFGGGLAAGLTAQFGAQFDAAARNWPTGQHHVNVFVRTDYGLGYFELDTLNAALLVVNERNAAIAKGWTVAGLQRIIRVGSTGQHAIVIEGDASIAFFASAGASDFTTPAGDFSRLRVFGSGGSTQYIRDYPDSTRVEFDNLGRMVRHITPTLRDTTQFTYDASSRLDRVYDPFRTVPGGASHLYTQLSYNVNGVASITEPGPVQTQAGGRVTTLTVAADRTLQTWTDPDGFSTQFHYDVSARLDNVKNRRGDTSFFAYDAVTWKLTSASAPSLPSTPTCTGRIRRGA